MFDPASIFLLIFIVALGLTFVTFLLGALGLDLPGADHGHAGGDMSAPIDGGGVHTGADLAGHGIDSATGSSAHHQGTAGASPFNLATILAFLSWFGGVGYLLTAHYGVGTLAAIVIAAGVGLAGAAAVFVFLARILLRGQTPFMREDDYRLEGTIGRLSVGIRGGRTGEIVYSKAGTRRVASARSANGQDIEQGAEVVIIQQEGNIAYVRRFEELIAEEPRAASRN